MPLKMPEAKNQWKVLLMLNAVIWLVNSAYALLNDKSKT